MYSSSSSCYYKLIVCPRDVVIIIFPTPTTSFIPFTPLSSLLDYHDPDLPLLSTYYSLSLSHLR